MIENGLIETVEPVAGTGHRREFAPAQVVRALVIRELKRKGMTLAQLTSRNLTFPESERFVVFDGNQLRTCRDAEAAVATVARAKRWCSVVDLATIRNAVAE
jgi:DNA-binding transcriptional MerR regulator